MLSSFFSGAQWKQISPVGYRLWFISWDQTRMFFLISIFFLPWRQGTPEYSKIAQWIGKLLVSPVWLLGIGSISLCETSLWFHLILAGGSFPSFGQVSHTSTNRCSANYLKGILYISQILCSTLSSLKAGTMNPSCLCLPGFISVSSAQGVCQVQLSRTSLLPNFSISSPFQSHNL